MNIMEVKVKEVYVVEWLDDKGAHQDTFKTFDEAFSVWEGLNEISGEPGCPIKILNQVFRTMIYV